MAKTKGKKSGRKPGKKVGYRHIKSRLKYTSRATRVDTNPIAPRFICKLKYCENISASLTSGVFYGPQRFNLNSIYDPNRTGGGHQPYGHDTLNALYNRYRVYKVTGYVKFSQTSSGIPVTIVVCPENNLTTYNGIDHMQESPMSQVGLLNHQQNVVTMKFRYYLPKIGGYKKQEYQSSSRTEATFGSDPSEVMTLGIGALAGGSGVTLNMQVTLVYHLECMDPKEIAQS